MGDIEIQTDRSIPVRRSDLILIKTMKRMKRINYVRL